MKTDYFSSQKKISKVWFLGAGLIFSIIFLQTVFGRYEDKVIDAWSWALPTVLPTLSLILGVFLNEINSNHESKVIDKFYYSITLYLSIFYLIIILLILLLQPLTNTSLIQLMKTSNIFLGPLQGIVAASVGLFFVKRE